MFPKTRRPIYIAVLVLTLFFAIGLPCLYVRATGMKLPFKRVARFSRPASLACDFPHGNTLLLDLSQNSHPYYRNISEQRQLGSNVIPDNDNRYLTSMAAARDGTRFYLCRGDELAEYGRDGTLWRRINISAFQFGLDDCVFSSVDTEASTERLFLSLSSPQAEGCFVVEWNPKKAPSTRIVTLKESDSSGARAILPGVIYEEDGIIHEWNSRKPITDSRPQYCWFDYSREQGLLLSDFGGTEEYDRILWATQPYRKPTDVTSGGLAHWGSDGYIYFTTGYTKLWRCRNDGSDLRQVYTATILAGRDTSIIEHGLKLSHDRSFLVYYYTIPLRDEAFNLIPFEYRWGLVLVDLIAREYMELREKDFVRLYSQLVSEDRASLDGETHYMIHKKEFWGISDMEWVAGSVSETMPAHKASAPH